MEQTYLAHHGIKGQKWGVRRFQNQDGSYTAAGKQRYFDEVDNYKKEKATYKQLKKSGASKSKLAYQKKYVSAAKNRIGDAKTEVQLAKTADKGKKIEDKGYTSKKLEKISNVSTGIQLAGSIGLLALSGTNAKTSTKLALGASLIAGTAAASAIGNKARKDKEKVDAYDRFRDNKNNEINSTRLSNRAKTGYKIGKALGVSALAVTAAYKAGAFDKTFGAQNLGENIGKIGAIVNNNKATIGLAAGLVGGAVGVAGHVKAVQNDRAYQNHLTRQANKKKKEEAAT